MLLLLRRLAKRLRATAPIGGAGRRSAGQSWVVARVAFALGWGLLLFNAVRVNFWAYTTSLVLFYVLVALSIVVAGGGAGPLSPGHGAPVGAGGFPILCPRHDHSGALFPALGPPL